MCSSRSTNGAATLYQPYQANKPHRDTAIITTNDKEICGRARVVKTPSANVAMKNPNRAIPSLGDASSELERKAFARMRSKGTA